MTVDISQNALQRSWQPCFPLSLQLCMVSMEQHVAAKDQVIQSSKKIITVVKKAHTVKNIVIGDLKTRKVHYLSQTYVGKRHDKKIVDEENPTFPKDISLYKDTGFQGYEPEDVQTEQNSLISRVRIVIEHILAGMKRCRIVKDVFRNTKKKYDDLVMEIACGLHNFRVHHR